MLLLQCALMQAPMIRSYTELEHIHDFMERFEYLKLGGVVGIATFGFDRYLNQKFYTSEEWKRFRRDIIIRDNGCDLGIDDGLHEIKTRIIIHHINPITPDDIAKRNLDIMLNPDNVICVSNRTHEAIHYSDESLIKIFEERKPGDTRLW